MHLRNGSIHKEPAIRYASPAYKAIRNPCYLCRKYYRRRNRKNAYDRISCLSLKKEFKPAVLSRGYLRKTRGFIKADNNPTPFQIGDEPSQIKQKFPDIEVAVDVNRVQGIEKLMSLVRDLDLIILDDAFQYRFIKPGLSLLLVDHSRPLYSDCLLPAGNLREPACGRRRADIIIVTKSPLNISPDMKDSIIKRLNILPHQHVFFSAIRYGSMINVFDNNPLHETGSEKNISVLMVCGIAAPANLKEYIQQKYTFAAEIIFPDHHRYTSKDLYRIEKTFINLPGSDKLIITTEKDAVRFRQSDLLSNEIKKSFFYIPVKTEFMPEYQEEFNQIILEYVKRNKRDCQIHKE